MANLEELAAQVRNEGYSELCNGGPKKQQNNGDIADGGYVMANLEELAAQVRNEGYSEV